MAKINYTAEQINHRLDLINENKNLLPYPYKTNFPTGLEDAGDGSILTTATTAEVGSGGLLLNTCTLPAGSYTISLSITDLTDAPIQMANTAGFVLAVYGAGSQPVNAVNGDETSFSLNAETVVEIYLNIPDSFDINLLIKPQIEKGAEKTDWVPYMEKIGNYVDERFNGINTKLRDVLAFMKLTEIVDAD